MSADETATIALSKQDRRAQAAGHPVSGCRSRMDLIDLSPSLDELTTASEDHVYRAIQGNA